MDAVSSIDKAWLLHGASEPLAFAEVLARTRRPERAYRVLEEQARPQADSIVNALDVINGYAALDELEEAFLWVERSIAARHEATIGALRVGVGLDTLRSDPRWMQVESRLAELPGSRTE
jgi:hypothetical protein